jgi:hypothetical protein
MDATPKIGAHHPFAARRTQDHPDGLAYALFVVRQGDLTFLVNLQWRCPPNAEECAAHEAP